MSVIRCVYLSPNFCLRGGANPQQTLAVAEPSGHQKRHSLSINNNQPPPPQSAAQTFSQPTASPATSHPPAQMQRGNNPPKLAEPKLAEPTTYQQFSARRSHSRERLPPTPTGQQASPQAPHPDLPPLKPVFGVSLEDLFYRDGTAIPMVVYQCIQAVELFGLDVEGIYRLSGTATHVARMKAMFDNGMVQHITLLMAIMIANDRNRFIAS